ncbi:MAG TPA: CYTH domain-containing protein [Candidatus Sulfotelmatobacter sp.]|jgi:adenylate cyclase|nr:CYTH domain-containing protein [Candidatus Sulfotelmatobacter sp.]
MDIPVEIERKFLVRPGVWPVSALPTHILQGYIASSDGPSVRVRLVGDKARLTIKQTCRDPGQGRAEFEYDIPADHARYMLAEVCARPPLEKLRHAVSFAGSNWVIDEFLGNNAGLVLAEIELKKQNADFPLPIWAIQDVTRDPRFRNSFLYHHPWPEWQGDDRRPTFGGNPSLRR